MLNTTREKPLFKNKNINIIPLFTPSEKNRYFNDYKKNRYFNDYKKNINNINNK